MENEYEHTFVLFKQAFEIVGDLDEALFCEHAKGQADSLGIRGYCMNTLEGTVNGEIQGPTHLLGVMKNWLARVGSPKSNIQYFYFMRQEPIKKFHFKEFRIYPRTPPRRRRTRWTSDLMHLKQ